MDKAFNTPLSHVPVTFTRKVAARTALVGLDQSSSALLAECFRQFGIECVSVPDNAAERLSKEKFEACVMSLNDGVEPVMEAARNSPSNSRCILYGVGGNAQQAMRFSKFGINAMFHDPLERPAALKLVRATRMLVQHEFRRYVRIPVITEVAIIGDGRRCAASSIEISSGGLSVKSAEDFTVGTNLEVSLAMMTLPRVNVRGVVSWRKPKSFGIRFDVTDDRRHKLKTWIDSYFEN
jgi:Tfp pilus assembly protein PilZ